MLGPAVFMVLGNHPGLLPVIRLCLRTHDITSHPLCELLSLCVRPTVPARLLDGRLRFRRKRVAVCVVTAFLLLVEVLVVVLSRVVLQLALGVLGFDVGGIVDARGVRSCMTYICVSLRLYDHPHHPSLRCLELLLHFPMIRSLWSLWSPLHSQRRKRR